MESLIKSAIILLALAASASADEVAVLSAFPAASAIGPKECPDNTGAAGPDHLVEFTDANVVIQDKKTGKTLSEMTQTEFWKTVKPGFDMNRFDDPRLLYDPLTKRWFAVISFWGYNGKAIGHLAVSETSDPTKGWRGVKLPMAPTDPGMRMGIDKNGLYIAYAVLGRDIHQMTSVHAIPKSDAISPEGPSLVNMQTFENLEMDAFPATDLDPDKTADAPEVLLNRLYGSAFSKMCMYKITWTGKTAGISALQTISLKKTYLSPDQALQPAPGHKLRADEARRTSAVYQHNGSIFSCNGAKRDAKSRCGVFWCEIRVKDGEVLQESIIDDKVADFLVPTLAVDAKGNVGLACSRTSENEFACAVVMMRSANDPKDTMRPPVLAMKGTSVFSADHKNPSGIKWGNYNATCLDPADPTTLWTTQEYAGSGEKGKWTTCWIAFKLK